VTQRLIDKLSDSMDPANARAFVAEESTVIRRNERARIVAWLRHASFTIENIAEDLERGEYERDDEGQLA
jgi:hypothetical protein